MLTCCFYNWMFVTLTLVTAAGFKTGCTTLQSDCIWNITLCSGLMGSLRVSLQTLQLFWRLGVWMRSFESCTCRHVQPTCCECLTGKQQQDDPRTLAAASGPQPEHEVRPVRCSTLYWWVFSTNTLTLITAPVNRLAFTMTNSSQRRAPNTAWNKDLRALTHTSAAPAATGTHYPASTH